MSKIQGSGDSATPTGRRTSALQALVAKVCSPTGSVMFTQNRACVQSSLSGAEVFCLYKKLI